jgi:hypothetical protein
MVGDAFVKQDTPPQGRPSPVQQCQGRLMLLAPLWLVAGTSLGVLFFTHQAAAPWVHQLRAFFIGGAIALYSAILTVRPIVKRVERQGA